MSGGVSPPTAGRRAGRPFTWTVCWWLVWEPRSRPSAAGCRTWAPLGPESRGRVCVNTFVKSVKCTLDDLWARRSRWFTKSKRWQWLCKTTERLCLFSFSSRRCHGMTEGWVGGWGACKAPCIMQVTDTSSRSIMERCGSQKGNFYHDVGHVSWGAVTKNNHGSVSPPVETNSIPFNKPRKPTNTEQRPCACHGVFPVMSLIAGGKKKTVCMLNTWYDGFSLHTCICWLETGAS